MPTLPKPRPDNREHWSQKGTDAAFSRLLSRISRSLLDPTTEYVRHRYGPSDIQKTATRGCRSDWSQLGPQVPSHQRTLELPPRHQNVPESHLQRSQPSTEPYGERRRYRPGR